MTWAAWLTLPFWLWVFFLAVMQLRDARDAGRLRGWAKGPAVLVLAVGYSLDVLAQVTWASLWFRELPPRRGRFPWFEPTISDRTKRWAAMPDDSFRRRSARELRAVMLAPFDKTGGHD